MSVVEATGGTETIDGDYKVHTFTGSGNFIVSAGGNIEILIVAGGGGGGFYAAGGGAGGGIYHNNAYSVTPQTYSVVVGAGGARVGPGASRITGGQGGTSSFGGLSVDGGLGGQGSPSAQSGPGGVGANGGANGGAAGIDDVTSPSGDGHPGGDGTSYGISGTAYKYGAGGGGSAKPVVGAGGLDGGGAGAKYAVDAYGGSGAVNSGGGGGGAWHDQISGAGGSGIVIIRYLENQNTFLTCPPVIIPVALSSAPVLGLLTNPIQANISLSIRDILNGYPVATLAFQISTEISTKPELKLSITPIVVSNSIDCVLNFRPIVFAQPIVTTIAISCTPTQFTIQNPSLLYFLTLTGAPDGLADIVIPMESFQARHRSGDPSYLSVVIPGVDNAAAIAARSNGEMVIHMSKAMGGVIYHTEEILRVELETIRTDEGSVNQSITLDGHKTTTYPAKIVALEGVTYQSVNGGKKLYRCATPNISLRPGDTATYAGDSFTVGLITYYVNATQQSMEVSEVA
jgi:hypothetical protein